MTAGPHRGANHQQRRDDKRRNQVAGPPLSPGAAGDDAGRPLFRMFLTQLLVRLADGGDEGLCFGQAVAAAFTQQEMLFQAGAPYFVETAEAILLQFLLLHMVR